MLTPLPCVIIFAVLYLAPYASPLDNVESVNMGEKNRSYRFTRAEYRWRIIECARRDDKKAIAKRLNIQINTSRAIAAIDRETAFTPGSYKTMFNDESVRHLCEVVDEKPTSTLRQLKERMEKDFPSTTVSWSSIDRLLDGHHYSVKKLTIQPVKRNSDAVKSKRAKYADWLQRSDTATLRLYIDETNFNIWCCRSYGRSKVGSKAIRILPSSKGPNLNMLACSSIAGILKYECHTKITWHIFNEFPSCCLASIATERSDVPIVFIFDNTLVHRRAMDT